MNFKDETRMKKQTLFRIALVCTLLFAVAASILQALALLRSYSADSNYFAADAILPTVAAALALLCGVCGILAASLADRGSLRSPLPDTAWENLPAGLGFAFCAFLLLFASNAPQRLLTAILSLCALLYSFAFFKGNAKAAPRLLPVLGFFAVAACAMINVQCYFDSSLEMNAPVKVTVQVALLFAMIYYTAEIRYLLGRQKPRFYLALSVCTLAALSLPALSIPMAHAEQVLLKEDYLAFSLASLGLMITMIFRILRTAGALSRAEEEQSEEKEEDGE